MFLSFLVFWLLFVFLFFVGFLLKKKCFSFFFFSAFGFVFFFRGGLGFFFFFLFFLTPVASRPMTPGDSDMWCLMMLLPRTLQIRRYTSFSRSRLYQQEWHCKDIHSHIHSHTPMHTPKTKSKTLKSPNVTPSFGCPLSVRCGGGRGQEAWQMLLRTAPRRRPSRLGQYWQKTFVDVFNTYSNISRQCLHNNLFLDGFNSSPGWLLVTRTRGAWWCRYRGHCRSGPRHFLHGPESALKNGIIKTFTRTAIPMHKNNSKMLNSPNMMPSFTGPLPVQCAGRRCSESLAPAPHRRPSHLGQF